MVWATLSSIFSLPIPNAPTTPKPQRGKPPRVPSTKSLNCVFRVVRVSGTIRKAGEEAIRRVREEIRIIRRLNRVGGEGGGLDKWLGDEEKNPAVDGKKVRVK